MLAISCAFSFLIVTNAYCIRLTLANSITFTFDQYIDQSSKWISGTSDTHSHIAAGDYVNVTFVCKAPYPVQWKTWGYLNPPTAVQLKLPKRNLVKNLYTISFKISSAHGHVAASLQVICEKIGFPNTRKLISLFARNDLIHYRDHMVLVKPQPTDWMLTDSKLIPCLTVHLDIKPTLHIWNLTADKSEPINDSALVYEPAEGFSYSDGRFFNHKYICRFASDKRDFEATTSNFSAYVISPVSNEVSVFSDSPIKLQCLPNSSSQVSLNLTVNSTEHIIAYSSQYASGKIVTVLVSQEFLVSKTEIAETDATCWAGSWTDPYIIKQWRLEFVMTPELRLSNYERKAQCIATHAVLQVLNCRNPIECLVMSRCLLDDEFCIENHKITVGSDFCHQTDTNELFHCSQGNLLGFYGLIWCFRHGTKLFRQLEYFASLDHLFYSDWREAPINELLRIDPVPFVLYTNTTNQFTCIGLSCIATSLYFELVFRNGTVVLLGSSKEVNIKNVGLEHSRKIRDFNSIAVLNIVLPLEATGIRCLAPWLNSTDILRAATTFETRLNKSIANIIDLQPPILPEASRTEGKQETTKRETFFLGQNSRKLVCQADGQPPPNYEWYFEGQNATEMFPELNISIGSKGESFLEFPDINESSKNYTGEWKCIARNKAGKVEIKYKVDVRADHMSQNILAYVLSTGGILLVLLGAIIVMWRRYKKAKELLRTLTEIEVDHFFKGKPELIQNEGNQVGSDYIDFLPYNNDYEVPLNDMEFDSSDKNILGSGFFSYVVRGRILSKEQPVAIKITKPTADVTLFKTLLSEVKIMLYIGEHQNVVSLVGVCTEGIRNRCIHIATHICDLGSLDHFLRKSRSTFVNLINENQEIDVNLLPVENPDENSAATLDLISFGYQIASGMEHLALKSIIHADLAARNVLLTGNKVCKVSDFGLSKKLYESNTYVKKTKTPLPWRWMAIEALTTLTFSTSSDIWAYGVTLFEIFSLGDIPFPNETWSNEFVSRLTSGMRMGRPEYTTQDIYAKVMACWERNPELRPEFSILREYFQNLHENLRSKRPVNIRQTYIANTDPCV